MLSPSVKLHNVAVWSRPCSYPADPHRLGDKSTAENDGFVRLLRVNLTTSQPPTAANDLAGTLEHSGGEHQPKMVCPDWSDLARPRQIGDADAEHVKAQHGCGKRDLVPGVRGRRKAPPDRMNTTRTA